MIMNDKDLTSYKSKSYDIQSIHSTNCWLFRLDRIRMFWCSFSTVKWFQIQKLQMLTLICADRFSHEITKVIYAKFSSRIADISLNTSLNCRMSHKNALMIMKLCLCCIEISFHMIKIMHFSKLTSFEHAMMKQMNVSWQMMRILKWKCNVLSLNSNWAAMLMKIIHRMIFVCAWKWWHKHSYRNVFLMSAESWMKKCTVLSESAMIETILFKNWCCFSFNWAIFASHNLIYSIWSYSSSVKIREETILLNQFKINADRLKSARFLSCCCSIFAIRYNS